MVAKLAERVAPLSVKRHLPEQEAERERREQALRDQQAAKLAEQRAKLAAGEAVRCASCFRPTASPDAAAEKHSSLVHTGDREQRSGLRRERLGRGARAMIRPPGLLASIAGETQMHHRCGRLRRAIDVTSRQPQQITGETNRGCSSAS